MSWRFWGSTGLVSRSNSGQFWARCWGGAVRTGGWHSRYCVVTIPGRSLAIWTRLSFVNPDPKHTCRPLLPRRNARTGQSGKSLAYLGNLRVSSDGFFVHFIPFSTTSQPNIFTDQLAVFEELCKILFEIIIYSSGVYIICCVAGFVIKQCPYWLNNNVINVSLRNHVISLYFTNRLHFPYCFKVYKLPPHHTQPPVLIKLVY